MLNEVLASVARDAAVDLDMLRLKRPERRHGVERVLEMLRHAFPAAGSIENNLVSASDAVFIAAILEKLDPRQRHLVQDVVRDINTWLDDLDRTWAAGYYEQRFVDFLLTVSRFASARFGGIGHTLRHVAGITPSPNPGHSLSSGFTRTPVPQGQDPCQTSNPPKQP